MLGALQIKLSNEEYSMYYKSLPKPVDFERFSTHFRSYLMDVQTGYDVKQEPYFMQ